ncbi:MAG: hypothetical protein ACJAV1_000097 [Paraglaciecola sp.]|jgi:hypothetical protein
MKQSKTIHHYGIILNATANRCGMLRLVVLLSLLLAGMPAQAGVAYQFSPTGQLPTGCNINSSSTTSYTCGAVTLAVGDTITVGSSTPVTVTFTGTFITAAGNMINTAGITSDLNLVMGGVVTLAANSIVNANVTGTAAINLGADSSIGGNITASTTTGVVSLGVNTTVGGFIHTDAGAVSVAGSSVVGGDIATDAGVVSLLTNISVGGGIKTIAGGINVGGSSTIGGDITTEAGVVTILTDVVVSGGIKTTAGGVTVGGNSTIDGDIITEAGVVVIETNVTVGGIETIAGGITVGAESSICGSVISTGAGIVTIATNVQIGGDITTVPGAITVNNGSTVVGNVISTGAGVVTSTNNLIGGNIFTVAGAITLTNSRVGGNVLSSGAGVVTTTSSFINDNTLFVSAPPSCSVTPLFDHIQIQHDGKGLTCAAEIVTLKACADSTCSTLYNDAIDVALSINGIVTQTINVVGGTSVANVAYTTEGTVTLSLSGGQTYQCESEGSTSCDLTFTDAGFRFLYGAAETTSISNQISGNDFTDIIKLQAVENVDGVCTGLFTGNIDVELSQGNSPTSGIIGLSFKVDGPSGTPIGKHPVFTPITLDFDADSKATIPTPLYLDAGKILLYAQYNVGGVKLDGVSTAFWVSPAKLLVTATAGGSGIIGNSSSSAIKHKAGQVFDFSVTAYNALGTLAGNITANYVPNDIQLLLTRTGPTAGGVDGTFNYGNGTILSSLTPSYQSVTLSAFDSGVYSTKIASYSEVGLLTLDLQDLGYGFSGNTITSDSLNIGRFTPDYFEQTVVEEGYFFAVCSQNTPFAYTGQVIDSDPASLPVKGAIYYLVNPVVELTAKNVQEVTTLNYTEPGYNKLIAAANFIKIPTTDATIRGKNTNLLPLTANLFAGTLSHDGLFQSDPDYDGPRLGAGVLHYELADDDNFFYPRNENSEVFAQDNDIDFLIDHVNFVDSDGIGITSPEDIIGTGSINIRFGRALIDNSSGPEIAELPQNFSTQYLNASGIYVINEQDSCTSYDTSNIILTTGTLDKNLMSVNAVIGQLEEGETQSIILTAPGAGNQGTIIVEYDIYPWLKFDWNGVDNPLFDVNPSATATFGIPRGDDRIIFRREN